MILNRSGILPLVVGFLLLLALSGCQSTAENNRYIPPESITPKIVSTVSIVSQPLVQTKEPKEKLEIEWMETNKTVNEESALQWASNYHWKLIQVQDQQGDIVSINASAPITLEIAPSSMSIYTDCERYLINFIWKSELPFDYGSELSRKAVDCKTNFNSEISKSSIEALFPTISTFKLAIELLPLAKNRTVDNEVASKNLVIKIEDGNTLIFSSKLISTKIMTGLPINRALLERYNWRLNSASRNTFDEKGQITSRQPINSFYHPSYPISLEFRNSSDSPYVAFSSNCNGSSAPYFLLKDNTLKVSNILSSAINCGKTADEIETTLFDLMRNSSSQLTLSTQPLDINDAKTTDKPRYQLVQSMETGETLVWHNEKKDKAQLP